MRAIVQLLREQPGLVESLPRIFRVEEIKEHDVGEDAALKNVLDSLPL
jgi:hypothetical protein